MILNLTQHLGTPDQGVTEPAEKGAVKALLDFSTLPSWWEIEDRAAKLAAIAVEAGAEAAMIGGAPYLMAPLEVALKAAGMGARQYPYEPPRTDTGIPHRAARLRALGNAVVPVQAYPFFEAIKVIEEVEE